jgi:hypothetical protein
MVDPHHATPDPHDTIAPIAELEDVAGETFDREVLVHRADDMVLRLEQH